MRDRCPSVSFPAALACAAMVGAVAILGHAGPLNPPAGPVASTFKTLGEVQPRIAINAVNTPGDAGAVFKITQPGSYYLTASVAGVSGKNGIEIALATGGPGASIDLMGFEVVGVSGSLDGIAVTASGTRNITIRNGTVRAWGGDGIDTLNSQNVQIADIRAFGNGGRGISAGPFHMVTGCTAQANALDGIRVLDVSTMSACLADNNTGDGLVALFSCTLTNCAAGYNGGRGIFADDGAAVSGCAAISNTGIGIFVNAGGQVTQCSSKLNTGHGISLGFRGTATGCTAMSNGGDGLHADGNATVTGCTATSNTSNGISVGNSCVVTRCSSAQNTGDGIHVGSDCQVLDNACSGNDPFHSGIFTSGSRSRIEGNNVSGSTVGINVDGSFNLIVRNSARGNTTNYDIVLNNRYGPIINIVNIATQPVTGSSATSAVFTTDPWANFAY